MLKRSCHPMNTYTGGPLNFFFIHTLDLLFLFLYTIKPPLISFVDVNSIYLDICNKKLDKNLYKIIL